MAGWGLVGAATARAPQEMLEELVAERIAAAEAQRKQEAEALKQRLDVGRFGLESERVGIDRRGADRADQYLGIAKEQDTRAGQKFATDQTYTSEDRALEAARRAEQAAAVGSAPAHLRPTLNFRRIGLGDVKPIDVSMSPEQQAADDAKRKAAEADADLSRDLRRIGAQNEGRIELAGMRPPPASERPRPMPAAIQDDLATMKTIEQMADEIVKAGDQSKWAGVGGMGAGTIGKTMAEMFGRGDQSAVQLRAKIGNIRGTITKLRGGTALSKQEMALLESYVPGIDESPLSIKGKLAELQNFIRTKRANTLAVSGQPSTAGGGTDETLKIEVWGRDPQTGRPIKIKGGD